MNKLVEPALLATDFAQHNALGASSAYWSDSYERRLKALFEAIVAEGIENRPSPDDVKPKSSF